MFGPGIAISASAASAKSASVDGAGIVRERTGRRGRGAVGAPCEARTVIARVEPLTTTRRLSGPFDYRVDGGLEIGSLVRIPFGHQKLDGVVVGLAETSEIADDKLVAP